MELCQGSGRERGRHQATEDYVNEIPADRRLTKILSRWTSIIHSCQVRGFRSCWGTLRTYSHDAQRIKGASDVQRTRGAKRSCDYTRHNRGGAIEAAGQDSPIAAHPIDQHCWISPVRSVNTIKDYIVALDEAAMGTCCTCFGPMRDHKPWSAS